MWTILKKEEKVNAYSCCALCVRFFVGILRGLLNEFCWVSSGSSRMCRRSAWNRTWPGWNPASVDQLSYQNPDARAGAWPSWSDAEAP